MKKYILIGCLLFSTNLYACQKCFDQIYNVRSSIERIIDDSMNKKEFNITPEQAAGIKAGMKSGLKTALTIINDFHPETNMSMEQYEEMLYQ